MLQDQNGTATSETSRPSDFASRTPWFSSFLQPLAVARLHQLPDHLARLRPPEDVRRELRQHRGSPRRRACCAPSARPTRAAPARTPSRRRGGSRRRSRAGCRCPRGSCRATSVAISRKRGMISRSKKTCMRKTFSSSESASRNMCAERVEVRVALALAADLADQLQPRLGVARLVLHHRRVVEPRLRVGRRVEQLRRHLDREHVGLELLHDDRAPDVHAPRAALRRALPLRHGAISPHGRSPTSHSWCLARW